MVSAWNEAKDGDGHETDLGRRLMKIIMSLLKAVIRLGRRKRMRSSDEDEGYRMTPGPGDEGEHGGIFFPARTY